MQTHETFIQAVAKLAIARLDDEMAKVFEPIKMVYGSGPNGTRGVTYYNRWKNGSEGLQANPLVEISAFGERDWVQVAGTTIHELGHVLAGFEAGHGKAWKEACNQLGLRKILAGGTNYQLIHFEPKLREAIASLEKPQDGAPVVSFSNAGLLPKPCVSAVGSRGGKTRGTVARKGKTYLVKCECSECGYTVRTTQKWLDVGLPICPVDKIGMDIV